MPHFGKTHDMPAKRQKKDKRGDQAVSWDRETVVWRFRKFDFRGYWGLAALQRDGTSFDVLLETYLRHFESMTWAEIKRASKSGRSRGSMHHAVDTDKLGKQAKNRLAELKYEDWGVIFSLRLDQKRRLFGMRDQNVFEVLWYDPSHEVCPSLPK